jgi:hypothetical protein
MFVGMGVVAHGKAGQFFQRLGLAAINHHVTQRSVEVACCAERGANQRDPVSRANQDNAVNVIAPGTELPEGSGGNGAGVLVAGVGHHQGGGPTGGGGGRLVE